jgi:hypothetical protein
MYEGLKPEETNRGKVSSSIQRHAISLNGQLVPDGDVFSGLGLLAYMTNCKMVRAAVPKVAHSGPRTGRYSYVALPELSGPSSERVTIKTLNANPYWVK